MGYPLVQIVNSTNYIANGTVEYASAFCSDDDYKSLAAGATWSATSRGTCLVTKITATLQTPGENTDALPYTSSGTSYSQFAIIQTGPNAFEVTRRVSQAEDTSPVDYVAPTEKQK